MNEPLPNSPQPIDITQQLRNQQQSTKNALETAKVSDADLQNMHQVIKNFYLPFFEEKDHRIKLVITNEAKTKPGAIVYNVTITKASIIFELSSDVKKNRIVYDFDKETIALNNDLKDGIYLKSFIEKLERMSADIRSNRAEVFEEFTPGNAPK